MPHPHSPTERARIGPNAIIQTAAAISSLAGSAASREIFGRADLESYLDHPPQQMVDERQVARLHSALKTHFDSATADLIALEAGSRTAEYLLAHRIPPAIRLLLKTLPAFLAARFLISAIGRNAWTFVGSGSLSVEWGHPIVLVIRDNPLCRELQSDSPACGYYAATFERLFRELVHPATRVTETQCAAMQHAACRFEISWRPAGIELRRTERQERPRAVDQCHGGPRHQALHFENQP
jgi:divinyl protochlorophyllide a 8-vinyl-reductase